MTEYVSLDDVLYFADRLGFHVRDAGLLESALARPATVAYGREVYASFPSKATALLESLTRNRGLLDGNKRTAWVALQHVVRLNGLRLTLSEDQAFDLVTGVAAAELTMDQTSVMLADHLVTPSS
ncbi:type II toxin-antitoxin system death-on-curing family toxin [Micrococcus terreus]|uniref:type II toxin-antitoxin system death-on-curing family toxin n=1 Tax=Micrococcus terreus TaxID=574650 RepID=UPI00254CF448|nr:Fic family protein [Micrococcus terreus]MDK7702385.1 Fic family protein [Micrococcus terreus]WOO96751.1 Fic family protein [Micrococcus terreus]